MTDTPAESLPPLDAGYYLATAAECAPAIFRFSASHGWFNREGFACDDPRTLGWTLTPVAAIEKLAEERDKLAKFKTYVHDRLDKMGVEQEPDGPNSECGCRIGDRLDIVHKALADLVAVRAERDGAVRTMNVLADHVNAARAELARLRMEQDGMRSAEELRQVRAERDAHANEENYLDAELQRVREALARFGTHYHECDALDVPTKPCDCGLNAALDATPPTRSAE